MGSALLTYFLQNFFNEAFSILKTMDVNLYQNVWSPQHALW